MAISARACLAIAALTTLTTISSVLAAGNVTVSVDDGILLIRGDNKDNRPYIRLGTEPGVFLLLRPYYDTDTMINGEVHTYQNPLLVGVCEVAWCWGTFEV